MGEVCCVLACWLVQTRGYELQILNLSLVYHYHFVIPTSYFKWLWITCNMKIIRLAHRSTSNIRKSTRIHNQMPKIMANLFKTGIHPIRPTASYTDDVLNFAIAKFNLGGTLWDVTNYASFVPIYRLLDITGPSQWSTACTFLYDVPDRHCTYSMNTLKTF
jgi:hypothetical protein